MENDLLKDVRLELSKTGFLYLKMLADRCGIDLGEYKKQAIYNRLVKRINFLNLPSFEAYCNLLRVNLEEEIKFINLITNNTTSFFREKHHFEMLTDKILPELAAKQKKIRIWSAGCSTGEEAYSIAIVIHEALPDLNSYDIKIMATDVNSDALDHAKKGIYCEEDIKNINPIRQKIWFEKKASKDGVQYEINAQLKKLITFNKLNLMSIWPMKKSFDIIFCRNVIIYFKHEISHVILEKFYHLLNNDGVLILGYSETLQDLRKHFKKIGQTTFRKIHI
jgi:chemotaxis protein methyltransferase CheR